MVLFSKIPISALKHTQYQGFYSRDKTGTHCIRGWVGPRAGLDGCGKSRTHRDSIPRPSALSESLYRLGYRPTLQYYGFVIKDLFWFNFPYIFTTTTFHQFQYSSNTHTHIYIARHPSARQTVLFHVLKWGKKIVRIVGNHLLPAWCRGRPN
jgi:hypothetical protein